MAKIDVNGDGKPDFSINITQIIALVTVIVSMAGSFYTLKSEIQKNTQMIERAMIMPAQEVKQKDLDILSSKFDLKLDKVNIQAKENMDNLKDLARELRNNYKRNR